MADRGDQCQGAERAADVPQKVGDREPLQRCQDPRLHIEGTPLTDTRKLGLLMTLVALAIAWVGRAAADQLEKHTPLRKSQGHYAESFFRSGFDDIRNRPRTAPLEAIQPWHRQRSKIQGVV